MWCEKRSSQLDGVCDGLTIVSEATRVGIMEAKETRNDLTDSTDLTDAKGEPR